MEDNTNKVILRSDLVKQVTEDMQAELRELGKELHMTKDEAESFERKLEKAIISNLEEGRKVQLIGFGSFEVVKRAARNGRNVRTEEKIFIPASMSPKFRAGKELKDAIKALPVTEDN